MLEIRKEANAKRRQDYVAANSEFSCISYDDLEIDKYVAAVPEKEDKKEELKKLLAEYSSIEESYSSLSESCDNKYKDLTDTVFEGITADMATRRLKEAEYQIKELNHLSSRFQMNLPWMVTAICMLIVAIMAIKYNERLWIVSGLLAAISIANYFVMIKTQILPAAAEEQKQEQFAAFGASSLEGMRENVKAYCIAYNAYLTDWHEKYKDATDLDKFRNKIGELYNKILAGSGTSLEKIFNDKLNESLAQNISGIILNDVLKLYDDDSLMKVMSRLKLISKRTEVKILSSSDREDNYYEKGWITPPAGYVQSTPFRLLG